MPKLKLAVLCDWEPNIVAPVDAYVTVTVPQLSVAVARKDWVVVVAVHPTLLTVIVLGQTGKVGGVVSASK